MVDLSVEGINYVDIDLDLEPVAAIEGKEKIGCLLSTSTYRVAALGLAGSGRIIYHVNSAYSGSAYINVIPLYR